MHKVYTFWMSPTYVYSFLTSAVFTISIEMIVLSFLLLFVFKKSFYSVKDLVTAGIFASSMTIPYVWFVFPFVTFWSRSESLFVSEPVVTIIEAIFYHLYLKLDLKRSFVISIACNLTSFLLGPILRTYGLWIFW